MFCWRPYGNWIGTTALISRCSHDYPNYRLWPSGCLCRGDEGVIASHSPTTPLIDLTHNIAPQDCYGARFQLLNAFPYFPLGTIHFGDC
ncbi:MAG: SAM-dependent chlorinase/fluorinase [Nodosilinea sp. LVE1205-7]